MDIVSVHTPVSGAYTLLATYERPFKAQGDTLTFTGARPLDAQTEQGHTLIVSAYQFQSDPLRYQPVCCRWNPARCLRVPLIFRCPNPGRISVHNPALQPEAGLESLSAGRIAQPGGGSRRNSTRISKEGESFTDVHYFIKSRGNPHFKLSLPTGTELWSATVNGTAVVPVADAGADLVPLPQGLDPNTVINLELQLAAKASAPDRVLVRAPIAATPVMLTEWKLEPDAGERLVYRGGSLKSRPEVLWIPPASPNSRAWGRGDETWKLYVAGDDARFAFDGVGRLAVGDPGNWFQIWSAPICRRILGATAVLIAFVCFAYLLDFAGQQKVLLRGTCHSWLRSSRRAVRKSSRW